MTKRILALLFALVMAACVLASCAGDDDEMHRELAIKESPSDNALVTALQPVERSPSPPSLVSPSIDPMPAARPTVSSTPIPTTRPGSTPTPTTTPPTSTSTPSPTGTYVSRHHITEQGPGYWCWCGENHTPYIEDYGMDQHSMYDCWCVEAFGNRVATKHHYTNYDGDCWCARNHSPDATALGWPAHDASLMGDCWCVERYGPIPEIGTIPSAGGEAAFDRSTEGHTFVPDQTGIWRFGFDKARGYNKGSPLLRIYDSNNKLIAGNGLDYESNNIYRAICIQLTGGAKYTIKTVYEDQNNLNDVYKLIVSRVQALSTGTTTVNNACSFSITPPSNGYYTFRLQNTFTEFSLHVRVLGGAYIGFSGLDDGRLSMALIAGVTYVVDVWSKTQSGNLSTTLTYQRTSMPSPIYPSSNGGTYTINETTIMMFTPARSDTWNFSTRDNSWPCYPVLTFFDSTGRFLLFTGYTTGQTVNASIDLVAGQTYIVVCDHNSGPLYANNLPVGPYKLVIQSAGSENSGQ